MIFRVTTDVYFVSHSWNQIVCRCFLHTVLLAFPRPSKIDHFTILRALHSKLVIEYLSQNSGRNEFFLQKWKFNFATIYSVYKEYMEENVFWILQNYKNRNILPFASPTYNIYSLETFVSQIDLVYLCDNLKTDKMLRLSKLDLSFYPVGYQRKPVVNFNNILRVFFCTKFWCQSQNVTRKAAKTVTFVWKICT